jgi:hypothetical protein
MYNTIFRTISQYEVKVEFFRGVADLLAGRSVIGNLGIVKTALDNSLNKTV